MASPTQPSGTHASAPERVGRDEPARERPEVAFVQAALSLRRRLEEEEMSWVEYQAAFMALVREDRERRPN